MNTPTLETVRDLVHPSLHSKAGGPPRAGSDGDISFTLNQWAQVIVAEFGIDPALLAGFREAQAYTSRLADYARRWDASTSIDRDHAAQMLAGADTWPDALTLLNATVRPANPDERAAGIDVIRRAQRNAERAELTAMRHAGPDLYEALQQVYGDSVTASIDAADQVPATVRTLDDAARAHVAEQYLALERERSTRQRILGMACAFYRWGVVKHHGPRPLNDTSPSELAYQDPQMAADLGVLRSNTHLLDHIGGPLLFDAHVLHKAGGRLRTTSDTGRSEVNTSNDANRVRELGKRLTGRDPGKSHFTPRRIPGR